MGAGEVRRGEIFSIEELYLQFKARYEDPKHTKEWRRQTNERWRLAFDAYSYTAELSDGRQHTVQIVKTNQGSYFLKLWGVGQKPFEISNHGYNPYIVGTDNYLFPQLCLLKEAVDKALEGVSLSAMVYTRSSGHDHKVVYEPVTAERCELERERERDSNGSFSATIR